MQSRGFLCAVATALLAHAASAESDATRRAQARNGTGVCSLNINPNTCPGVGVTCDETLLCQSGSFCKATTTGTTSFTGSCAVAPEITDKYGSACVLGNSVPDCVFYDHLRMSPRDPPSALQCVKGGDIDPTKGTCRIGPNKHGDACNVDDECASGRCDKQLRACHGIDEGEACDVGFPDPCAPNHYCLGQVNSNSGTCMKSVSAGKTCSQASACERGLYCAGADVNNRRCTAPFSVPTGMYTTIGPFMCATANALITQRAPSSLDSVYLCVNATSTMVGLTCDPAVAPPAGYQCLCTTSGQYQLRTVNALGLGSRALAWRDLYNCLSASVGVMGDPCQFDAQDLIQLRYGSCGYYACYPFYLNLVNSTGGRTFAPPLNAFESYAPCEIAAATTYYQTVASSKCVELPNLENWKCATLVSTSLSLASTSAVVSIILLAFFFGYIGHMYYYRKDNKQWMPFVKNH